MRSTEKFTDEAKRENNTEELRQELDSFSEDRFSDLSWEKNGDLKEICDNFRIIGRQRDLYRERCIRLQKENEDLRQMLDKIQIMVCQYSNG